MCIDRIVLRDMECQVVVIIGPNSTLSGLGSCPEYRRCIIYQILSPLGVMNEKSAAPVDGCNGRGIPCGQMGQGCTSSGFLDPLTSARPQ